MSLEDFQIKDNETIDNSILKRDFLKIYHQQAAILNDCNQTIEFRFGEKNNYHQIGNAYLQYEMTIEKDVTVAANRVLANADAIRLVKIAFAYCFKGTCFSTIGGSDIEHKKYVGQNSTIMRTLTSKDGDFLSHFDEIDELEAEIENTSLHHHLINTHVVAGNKGKIKRYLNLEHIFVKLLKSLPNN